MVDVCTHAWLQLCCDSERIVTVSLSDASKARNTPGLSPSRLQWYLANSRQQMKIPLHLFKPGSAAGLWAANHAQQAREKAVLWAQFFFLASDWISVFEVELLSFADVCAIRYIFRTSNHWDSLIYRQGGTIKCWLRLARCHRSLFGDGTGMLLDLLKPIRKIGNKQKWPQWDLRWGVIKDTPWSR